MKKRVKIIITIAVIILCYYLYVKKDSPSTANFSSSSEITMSNAKFVLDQNYTLTADKQSVNSERTQVTFINPKLVSQNYTLQSNNGIYSKTDSSINLTNNVVMNYNASGSSYIVKSSQVDYTTTNQHIVSTGDTNLEDVTNNLNVDASGGVSTYQNSPTIQLEGSVVIKTSSIEVDGTDVTYNRSTQLLTSSKPMTIKSSGGQIILNNNPVIDLKNQNFSGNNSVLNKGNSHVECNRLVYSQKSSIANLTGNVHGVIAQNGDSTAIQSDVAVITFSKDNVSSLLMNGVVNINSQSFGELQANQVQYTNGIVIAKGSVKSIINNSKNQGAINSKQITIYCDSLQTNFSKATRKITLLNISGNAKILADNGQYIYGNQIITDTTTYFNVNGNGKMQLDNMKNGVIVTYNVISNIILTNFLKNGSAAELSSVNLTGVGSRFSDSLGDFLTGSKIALVSDKSLDASGNVSGKIIGANAVTYSANEMSLVLGNNNVLMSGTFDGKGYVNIDNKYQVYGNHIACDLVGHTAESVGNAKIITLSERPGVGPVTYNLVANRINTLLQGDNEGVNKMDASGNAQFSSTIGDNTNASTIVLDNITQTLTANGNVTGNWVNTQGNPQTKNITFGAQQIVVQYTKQNINGPSQEEVCGAVMQGDAFLKTVSGTLRSNTINYDKLNDVITGKENVTVNYSAVNTNGHPYVVTVTGEILNYIVSQNKIYVIKNVVSNLISDGNEVTVTGQNAMFDNVAQKIYFSKNVSATEKNLNITNVDEGVYDIASQNLKIYGYNIRYNYK